MKANSILVAISAVIAVITSSIMIYSITGPNIPSVHIENAELPKPTQLMRVRILVVERESGRIIPRVSLTHRNRQYCSRCGAFEILGLNGDSAEIESPGYTPVSTYLNPLEFDNTLIIRMKRMECGFGWFCAGLNEDIHSSTAINKWYKNYGAQGYRKSMSINQGWFKATQEAAVSAAKTIWNEYCMEARDRPGTVFYVDLFGESRGAVQATAIANTLCRWYAHSPCESCIIVRTLLLIDPCATDSHVDSDLCEVIPDVKYAILIPKGGMDLLFSTVNFRRVVGCQINDNIEIPFDNEFLTEQKPIKRGASRYTVKDHDHVGVINFVSTHYRELKTKLRLVGLPFDRQDAQEVLIVRHWSDNSG